MIDAVLANTEVMGDQQGIELVNQSASLSAATRTSTGYPNVMSNFHNTSCRLSFSKLEVALMIAVAIFAILSTVFMAMYFTTDGNACCRQNNKGNESKNCSVKCSANQTTPNNSGTG